MEFGQQILNAIERLERRLEAQGDSVKEIETSLAKQLEINRGFLASIKSYYGLIRWLVLALIVVTIGKPGLDLLLHLAGAVGH